MKGGEKVELGSKYRDVVFGIEGIATVRSEFMSGCARVCLAYVVDKEMKEIWIDEPQLELVEAKEAPAADDKGGPGPVPPMRSTGKR